MKARHKKLRKSAIYLFNGALLRTTLPYFPTLALGVNVEKLLFSFSTFNKRNVHNMETKQTKNELDVLPETKRLKKMCDINAARCSVIVTRTH